MTFVRQANIGNQPSGADAAAVDLYDAAVDAHLRIATDVGEAWEATVADHPGFVLGHIGRAYVRTWSSEEPAFAEARSILADLGEPPGLDDRERRHLGAAWAYATGDLVGAAERLAALSVAYPYDTLALAVGHILDFFVGDAAMLRDRIGRALPHWDSSHPHYGYLLGMHAFGLEECGAYQEAEQTGMGALERHPRDVWALHAVSHTHEMQSRVGAGLAFLAERRADWEDGNLLAVHVAWHEALLLLGDGQFEAALAAYDRGVAPGEGPQVALDLVDAAALLWRLHLDRADVGERWQSVAQAWESVLDEPWYVFNDVHAVMALVGAGRLDDARKRVERLARDRSTALTNNAMTARVGLPICSAIVAFGEGRYGDVIDLLQPIRRNVQLMGGSNAQRDAVARTLFEAAIRAGEWDLARALASERTDINPADPYTRRQLSRITAVA
jgi:tetratricopeptide (TPR) repeat protein